MWSIGRYDLRLSEDEFWALTPREFSLLLRRWQVEGKWREAMAAITPWVLASIHRDTKSKREPWLLSDFTVSGLLKPSPRAAERRPDPDRPDAKTIWNKVGAVMTALGGRKRGNDSR